jgi:peptidoglycan/LPS O-acetylase OafA/YrhL
MGQESSGGLAVFGFFVVSGFLVTRSFDGSPNFISYIWKRFLRIFPGFWVCLLVTVLVFAPLAFLYEHGSIIGYLHTHPDSPSGYLKNNALLSMNQYNIDNLLGNNPYAHIHAGFQAWDGSLWTLIYEFKCYLGVMVLGMIGVFRKWRPTVLVLSLGLWALQLKQYLHPGYLAGTFLLGDPNMVRLAFIFSLGMIFYLYRDKIIISNTIALVALVVFVAGMRLDLFYGVGSVMWAYLVMWAAVRLPFHNVDKYGDFSYGLYIYAFPVEQMMSLYHVNSWGYAPYVLLSLAVALILAVGSWYAIEKPAQQLKRLNFRRPRRADPRSDPVVEQATLSQHAPAPPPLGDLESSVSRADGMQNATSMRASLGTAGYPPGPHTFEDG